MKTYKSLALTLIASATLMHGANAQTGGSKAAAIGPISPITPITNCLLPFDHDNFTNPAAWTIVDGTQGNGSVVVNGGKLTFSNADGSYTCASNHGVVDNREVRTYRPLSGVINNHSWRAQFKFRITDGNGPTYTLLALTGSNKDPQGTNPAGSGWGCGSSTNTSYNFTNDSVDGIMASLIAFGTDQNASTDNNTLFPGSYSATATPGAGTHMGWRIFGHAKSKSNPAAYYPAHAEQAELVTPSPGLNWSRGILLPSLNTDYYLRLERINSSTCRISIFSDSAMTVNLPGSPQCFTINPNIANLNTVQSAASPSGGDHRSLAGYIQNLEIYSACPYGIPNFTLTSGNVTPCCTDTLYATPGFTNYTWYPSGINTGTQNWLVVTLGSSTSIDSVIADYPGYAGCPFIASDTLKPCKTDWVTPDPTFSLSGNLPATGNYFTVAATPTMSNTVVTGYGYTYGWQIQMEDASGSPVYCTITNPINWQTTAPTTTFPGYNSTGSNTCSNSGVTTGNGNFYVGYRYKITRGIKCRCGLFTSSKSIMLCQTCKSNNGQPVFTIIDEDDSAPLFMDAPELVTGIEGIENGVKVYPNPSKGVFNIELGSSASGSINIYDMMGRTVKTIELNNTDTSYRLDLSGLPKGLYIMNMVVDGKNSVQKLILE